MTVSYKRLRLSKRADRARNDTARIGELLSELRGVPTNISTEEVAATIQSVHTFLVARSEKKIVGMSALYVLVAPHKKYAHIELVVVHPLHRGKGIGENLLLNLISIACSAGAAEIQLTSNHTKAARVQALALYKKLGFIEPVTTLLRLTL